MCRLILLTLFLWALLLGVAITLAAMFLPWWSVPLIVFGYILVTATLVKWGFKRLLLLPFKAKGAALRGATLEVHAVDPTDAAAQRGESPAPALEAAEEEDSPSVGEARVVDQDASREWYWLDVTIAPRAAGQAGGAFRMWEPSELLLIPAERQVRSLKDLEEGLPVRQVRVWTGQEWGPDDPGKYEGTRRLRLLVSVAPDYERRLKLQYYLETFGEIRLPRGMVDMA